MSWEADALGYIPVGPYPRQLPLFCWLFPCQRTDYHVHGVWTAP